MLSCAWCYAHYCTDSYLPCSPTVRYYWAHFKGNELRDTKNLPSGYTVIQGHSQDYNLDLFDSYHNSFNKLENNKWGHISGISEAL